jgi:hypothetical protein
MRGVQDVRLGAEATLALGHAMHSIQKKEDFAVTASAYGGVNPGNTLLVARSRLDMRRDRSVPVGGDHDWADVYAEGELLAYHRPGAGSRHTLFFRASGIGAWNTRTPFQLTLGGERAMRAYDLERFPGGQRAVFTLEDRLFIGSPFSDALDLGATLFVEAGRMFAGDVPFAMDSGWRLGAGLGVRGSFPAGSRTTYRLDFGWPIGHGARFGDFQIRMSVGEMLGLTPREADLQLIRSRPDGVASSLFQFGN